LTKHPGYAIMIVEREGYSMKFKQYIEDGILFDDGTEITARHYQSCCEHVYADFEQLEDTGFMEAEFHGVSIEVVPNNGFKLNGYFVPCYNRQNGYYGSNLELIIDQPDRPLQFIDLTNAEIDQIY